MSANSQALELQAGALTLALRPDLGACIAGLWHGGLPVLRSTDASALASARLSGCYPLLPYSNRVAYRRFEWLGQPHTTQPNFDDNPHSVHGVGWQRAWTVASHGDSEAVLTLAHAGDADWPFPFEARQSFRLSPHALDVRLTFTNTADSPAPVGLGWHPYFPKRARSRLHIELSDRWDSDASTQLPTRKVAQQGIDADVAHLQYDHCFEGWSGAAHLRDESLSLKLSSPLRYLVVFTPQDRAYYCVEPVSHVSNAINMADPLAHGLRSVAPGATTTADMRLEIAGVH
jgi:aldose 1-epimerase